MEKRLWPNIKGFLTIQRKELARRPVKERVKDRKEVYVGTRNLLPIISEQAGRCMDCGVPFCHSGCPLGNLIPEWNGLMWQGDFPAASDRLHATNNFPEFTGRLCPAPCETACVLAINQPAVTIKPIEVAIADNAWDEGLIRPLPPGVKSGKSVAIIGSGPAGLSCAQQLTRAGHSVEVFERDDKIGGLLRYGIPDFKMEKRFLDRRVEQMEAEGTQFYTGVEIGRDLDATDLMQEYDAVVVAIGAGARRELKKVPGRELDGVHQAMDYLTEANRANQGETGGQSPLSAQGKQVVIIGGGDTGADCVGTAVREGATSVVQLDINPMPSSDRPEYQPWPIYPRILLNSPAYEEAKAVVPFTGDVFKGLEVPQTGPDGDIRIFSASTVSLEGDDNGHVQKLKVVGVDPSRIEQEGTERTLPADLVLLALGFEGPERTNGMEEQLGLMFDQRGNFARNDDFTVGPNGVFVAGDAGRGASLVVWAIAEGRAAAASVDNYLMGSTTLPSPIRASDVPMTI